jgi:hypothetical protein
VDATAYRKNFRDIVRGYSTSDYRGETVYIKHLTPHDQVEIEEIEKSYYDRALERGVPTESDMLELLKAEGDWTDEEEAEVENQKAFLQSLQSAKARIVLPSHMEAQDKLIETAREEIRKKEIEKIGLVGNTCEKYSKDRTNDFYIIKSFFSSAELIKPLFEEEEFNDLDAIQLREIVSIYNISFASISEGSIQHMILQDFYGAYLGFTEDSMQFYGKPFCELTYCQIKLIVYSRIFKNIFDSEDSIPEKIRKDPLALLDFASTNKEDKEKFQSKFAQSDGSTIVGATEEDYKQLGLGSSNTVSLHEEAKKKGGTLSMQDLMKLSGVEQ